jgi:hypothetical protein
MVSMRDSLQMIGEPKPGQAIPPFPGGFHSAPRSLRAALRAMNPPQIESWRHAQTTEYDNKLWTEECQGLTTDGQHWYVSSNNEDFRGIHKFPFDFAHFDDPHPSVELPSGLGNHIGALDHHEGRIYVAVEPTPRVWMLDHDLNTLGTFDLGGAQSAMPWCAINPWNGWLYSSDSHNVDRVHAYDPADGVLKGFLRLEGPEVDLVQGGCFSANGHLYLTSDATEEIRAYSALNGAFLGSQAISISSAPFTKEEVEGLAVARFTHAGGDLTHVHLVILDNDAINEDDVDIQHYAVPNPEFL